MFNFGTPMPCSYMALEEDVYFRMTTLGWGSLFRANQILWKPGHRPFFVWG